MSPPQTLLLGTGSSQTLTFTGHPAPFQLAVTVTNALGGRGSAVIFVANPNWPGPGLGESVCPPLYGE